ncbi:MAG: hypothetical protein ACHQC9_09530 [Alphaproteobacteria bacterium]
MKVKSCMALCLAVGLSLVTSAAGAQQIYNNWNTDACGFTDHASFILQVPTRLTSIELWYRWGSNESDVDYELFHNGVPVKTGRLMRADCDPYQESWCSARGNVGADLPPGQVVVRTARGKVCQNGGSGGQGFIHAYGMPH